MTLSDRPPQGTYWASDFPKPMLEALGTVALVASEIELLLHVLYWKHAGLTEETGPIVTDNLNPKRLGEDAIKLAKLKKSNVHIVADLKVLMKEMDDLNERRNQYLHWIWEYTRPNSASVKILFGYDPTAEPPFVLKKPKYMQKNKDDRRVSIEEVRDLIVDLSWLRQRLNAHSLSDVALEQAWEKFGSIPIGPGNLSFAEVYFPAPWRSKPIPPESTPSSPPDGQK